MNPETSQVPRRRAQPPEDFDAQGRYLYPGDVEDAMPEGTWARLLANYLVETILRVVVALDGHSAHANLPIYYRQGEPKKHVSPDAFYVPGVPYDKHRMSYCLWETGVIPRVVFEILSPGSQWKDRVANRRIYEELGIPEYYWFDPKTRKLEALMLDSATQRYRERVADRQGRSRSDALGLEVGVEEDAIALYRDGVYLPPTEELLRTEAQRRMEAELLLAEKAQRLTEAEARIRDLEQRLRDAGHRAP